VEKHISLSLSLSLSEETEQNYLIYYQDIFISKIFIPIKSHQ